MRRASPVPALSHSQITNRKSQTANALRRSSRQQRHGLALLGRAELLERPAFNLADAFARDGQALADLLQRVFAIGAKAVAQTEHFLLAIRQRRQGALDLV